MVSGYGESSSTSASYTQKSVTFTTGASTYLVTLSVQAPATGTAGVVYADDVHLTYASATDSHPRLDWLGRGASGVVAETALRVLRHDYDNLERLLTVADLGATSAYYTSTYDLAGNRTSTKQNAAATVNLSYNAADQLTTGGMTYDEVGNLKHDGTRAYTFDPLNRLTKLVQGGTTTTQRYNGDGVLVRTSVGASVTDYTQDLLSPLSQVLAQTAGGTTTRYGYGLGRLWHSTSGIRTWEQQDALGSVRLRQDGVGGRLATYAYDAWGTPLAGSSPAPFGFTGELQDTTNGLVYLRARWYQPGTARFTGRDPFQGVDTMPYSLHPYQYGYSNPVSNTDPSGLFSQRTFTPNPKTSFNLNIIAGILDTFGIDTCGKISSSMILTAEDIKKAALNVKYGIEFMDGKNIDQSGSGEEHWINDPLEKVGQWRLSELENVEQGLDKLIATAGWTAKNLRAILANGKVTRKVKYIRIGRDRVTADAAGPVPVGNGIDVLFIRFYERTFNQGSEQTRVTTTHETAHVWDFGKDRILSRGMQFVLWNKKAQRTCGVMQLDQPYPRCWLGSPASEYGKDNAREDWAEAVAATVYPNFYRFGTPSPINPNNLIPFIDSHRSTYVRERFNQP